MLNSSIIINRINVETPSQAPSLADMAIVITGGAGTIGGAAASVFKQEARGVVIFGHRVQNSPGNPAVLAIPGDMASPEDVQRLCDLTLARFGRIDAVINCAGKATRSPFLEMAYDDFKAVQEINLNAYALLCQKLLPPMIKNSFGRIVNITTRLTTMPGPKTSAYSSSKLGAHILTQCMAAEILQLGHQNILINDLIPGATGKEGQDPLLVVPFLRELILQPAGSPTGKTYFRGKLFDLFKEA